MFRHSVYSVYIRRGRCWAHLSTARQRCVSVKSVYCVRSKFVASVTVDVLKRVENVVVRVQCFPTFRLLFDPRANSWQVLWSCMYCLLADLHCTRDDGRGKSCGTHQRHGSFIARTKHDCTAATCSVGLWPQTRDGRLSAAQTTAKVSCELHSQHI